jgi:large subunit ribosomal protein L29
VVKTENFRSTSIEELQALHIDTKKALFELVNELKSTKKLDKPHLIRTKKKEIARILTVLREKELLEER